MLRPRYVRHSSRPRNDAGYVGAMTEVIVLSASDETVPVYNTRNNRVAGVQIGMRINSTVDNRDADARTIQRRVPRRSRRIHGGGAVVETRNEVAVDRYVLYVWLRRERGQVARAYDTGHSIDYRVHRRERAAQQIHGRTENADKRIPTTWRSLVLDDYADPVAWTRRGGQRLQVRR